MTMMTLGSFEFSLATLAYQTLQRQTAWRYASTSRIGARPTCQSIGPGDETFTLSGLLAPELTGTLASLDLLEMMQQAGQAYPLIDGLGRVYGAFVIESLTQNQTYFTREGVPQRLEFTLMLKRVEDNEVVIDGSP